MRFLITSKKKKNLLYSSKVIIIIHNASFTTITLHFPVPSNNESSCSQCNLATSKSRNNPILPHTSNADTMRLLHTKQNPGEKPQADAPEQPSPSSASLLHNPCTKTHTYTHIYGNFLQHFPTAYRISINRRRRRRLRPCCRSIPVDIRTSSS